MTFLEHEPLARHTTLGVGGSARFFATITSSAELEEASAFAREKGIPIAILGGGSNTLVPDAGFEGLVLKIDISGIEFTDEGETVRITTGAGVSWDALVREASQRSLWGIENLAGIPGTVGGAVVQNIGAYGMELKDSCIFVETFTITTGEVKRLERDALQFGYRDSIFKHAPELVVLRVTLTLGKHGAPRLSYGDFSKVTGALSTPDEIGNAVRAIRSKKFPQREGTAGSFFKNPILTAVEAEALVAKFPGLPTFSSDNGHTKIPLAWILDRVLQLKGHRVGKVRLFENQPLVLVAEEGAEAKDIDTLANHVIAEIHAATGIEVEREVVTLGARKLSTHSR